MRPGRREAAFEVCLEKRRPTARLLRNVISSNECTGARRIGKSGAPLHSKPTTQGPPIKGTAGPLRQKTPNLARVQQPWIPITEPTMLRVAPGWRPPPYPQALACALAAHAAHARARPAHAARTPAHARARPRTPAHVRARPRTPHYAALPRFPHAQIPSRSDSLTLRFRARGCRGMPQAGME